MTRARRTGSCRAAWRSAPRPLYRARTGWCCARRCSRGDAAGQLVRGDVETVLDGSVDGVRPEPGIGERVLVGTVEGVHRRERIDWCNQIVGCNSPIRAAVADRVGREHLVEVGRAVRDARIRVGRRRDRRRRQRLRPRARRAIQPVARHRAAVGCGCVPAEGDLRVTCAGLQALRRTRCGRATDGPRAEVVETTARAAKADTRVAWVEYVSSLTCPIRDQELPLCRHASSTPALARNRRRSPVAKSWLAVKMAARLPFVTRNMTTESGPAAWLRRSMYPSTAPEPGV